MHYGLDTLVKIGGLAHVDVPLSKLTPRTASALKRGFKRGMIESTTGQTALYMSLLCDDLQIPMLAFSKNGNYWSSLYMKYMPEQVEPALSDWWKADRVAYRLENPNGWNEYMKGYERYKNSSSQSYYDEIIEEPDWSQRRKPLGTIRILGTRTLDVFEPIANLFTRSDEYKDKVEKAIQLIEKGETLHVTSDRLN